MAGQKINGGSEPMMSIELQDAFVVQLLQGLWQMAVNDTKVAGFCPYVSHRS